MKRMIIFLSYFFVILFFSISVFSDNTTYINTYNNISSVYGNFSFDTLSNSTYYTFSGNETPNPSRNDGEIFGKTFNDGTVYGSVFSGNGVYFDGINDRINLNSNFSELNGSEEVSISFWASVSDFQTTTDSNNCIIRGGSTGTNSLGMYIKDSSTIRYFMYTNGTGAEAELNIPSGISLDTFYFWTLTYDGSAIKIYKNGNLENSDSITGSLNLDTSNFYLGARAGSSHWLNGSIRDLRIYNRALSVTEIENLYNETNEPTEGLVAYYPLHNHAQDMNHLASHRIANNTAMHFDGVDDKFYIGEKSVNSSYTIFMNMNVDYQSYNYILGDEEGSHSYIRISDGKLILEGNTNGNLCYGTLSSVAGWKNYVIIVDNGNCSFFQNGNDITTDSSISAPLEFRYIGGDLTHSFNGSLDNIRIYNRSLTELEIQKLYNNTYHNTSGLIAHYTFDDLDNTKIRDRSYPICLNCYSSEFTQDITTEGFYTTWIFSETSNTSFQRQFYIDFSYPTTSIEKTGTMGNNNYYIEEVQINLTATDSIDEVSATYYRINSGSWVEYSGVFNVSTQGNITFEYYSVDNSGNSEPINEENFLVDTVNPSTNYLITSTVGLDSWHISQPYIDLNALDSSSGINYTSYRINNGSWINYTSQFQITEEGNFTIDYYSVDNSGNIATIESLNLSIDITLPITTATITGTTDYRGWYMSDIIVDLSAVDNVSGVLNTYYKTLYDTYEIYSSVINYSSDVIFDFTYYTQDIAGNNESPTTFQIIRMVGDVSEFGTEFNLLTFTTNVSNTSFNFNSPMTIGNLEIGQNYIYSQIINYEYYGLTVYMYDFNYSVANSTLYVNDFPTISSQLDSEIWIRNNLNKTKDAILTFQLNGRPSYCYFYSANGNYNHTYDENDFTWNNATNKITISVSNLEHGLNKIAFNYPDLSGLIGGSGVSGGATGISGTTPTLIDIDYEEIIDYEYEIIDYIDDFNDVIIDESIQPVVIFEIGGDSNKSICDLSLINEKLIINKNNNTVEFIIKNKGSLNYEPKFAFSYVSGDDTTRHLTILNNISVVNSNGETIYKLKFDDLNWDGDVLSRVNLVVYDDNCKNLVIPIKIAIISDKTFGQRLILFLKSTIGLTVILSIIILFFLIPTEEGIQYSYNNAWDYIIRFFMWALFSVIIWFLVNWLLS